MKNSDSGFIFVCIIFVVLSIFLSKWIFETVMGSNLPNWLKYMLLR